jgi:large subunit ribosomal protein L23
VRALSVRSSIKQQPLRGVPEDPRRLFRPESKKYMTIEMDRPFVWPKEPEDFTPWGKKDREHDEKAMVETSVGREMAEQIKGMREHAKSMVMGEEVGLSAWEKQRSGKYIRAEEDSYKIKV